MQNFQRRVPLSTEEKEFKVNMVAETDKLFHNIIFTEYILTVWWYE